MQVAQLKASRDVYECEQLRISIRELGDITGLAAGLGQVILGRWSGVAVGLQALVLQSISRARL